MLARSLPGADFFLPPWMRQLREREELLGRAREAGVLHLSHAGCLDGAGSDVVVRLAHGDAAVRTVWADPAEVVPRLEVLAASGLEGRGRLLLLSDVSPQVGPGEAARLGRVLERLAAQGWRVQWRDHHGKQWGHGALEAVKAHAEHVRVDLGNTECGTSLCQQDLLPDDPFARELGAVVRDIDLWLRRDPRSDTLTAARHALDNPALVRKLVHDRVVLDEELEAAARTFRREFERDVRIAIANTRIVKGRNRVGVLYGDFPGSQACQALRDARDTDVEINLKPTGKFSIRSREGLPFCHAVAQRFRGGGHPNASGGRVEVRPWEWGWYWASGGRCAEADALARAAADAEVPPPGPGEGGGRRDRGPAAPQP